MQKYKFMRTQDKSARWVLESLLGKGAFGEVFLALDSHTLGPDGLPLKVAFKRERLRDQDGNLIQPPSKLKAPLPVSSQFLVSVPSDSAQQPTSNIPFDSSSQNIVAPPALVNVPSSIIPKLALDSEQCRPVSQLSHTPPTIPNTQFMTEKHNQLRKSITVEELRLRRSDGPCVLTPPLSPPPLMEEHTSPPEVGVPNRENMFTFTSQISRVTVDEDNQQTMNRSIVNNSNHNNSKNPARTVGQEEAPPRKKKSHLEIEAKVYKVMMANLAAMNMTAEQVGIPNILWEGKIDNHAVLAMDLQGPSLKSFRMARGGKLPLEHVATIGLQLISRIEFIHSCGLVYRDVKPHNFLIQKDIPDLNTIEANDLKVFAIDFNLASYYRNMVSGLHYPLIRSAKKTRIGTARYASINVHNGLTYSRRDDIESIAYVLYELYTGELPWDGVKKFPNSPREGWAAYKECKEATSVFQMCKDLPEALLSLLIYARNLEFERKPDYDYLRRCLSRLTSRSAMKPIVSLPDEKLRLAQLESCMSTSTLKYQVPQESDFDYGVSCSQQFMQKLTVSSLSSPPASSATVPLIPRIRCNSSAFTSSVSSSSYNQATSDTLDATLRQSAKNDADCKRKLSTSSSEGGALHSNCLSFPNCPGSAQSTKKSLLRRPYFHHNTGDTRKRLRKTSSTQTVQG